ncbi:MAG: hypothetical protein HYX99_02425 [Chloroflexi bacterium]|nr:hypothetical protein [Chloroflexota bacterium]
MAVKVTEKQGGKVYTGKYASVKGSEVKLFSGIMSDKKGGWSGCGKCTTFPADTVTVSADNPAAELKKT